MDSAGKRVKVKNEPAHGPPLQARVVAANRTVLTTCASILAHMELNRGGKAKLNGAKCAEQGSGHGMAKGGQANKARRTRPLQATQPANGLPGTGLEEQQPAVGWPRSKTTAADVGRPLAVQCR